MGRLVRKPIVLDFDPHAEGAEGVSAQAVVASNEPGDDYLMRVMKYVPAEIIGFLMLINSILEQALKNGGKAANMAGIPVVNIATGSLVVACVMTPLFCLYVREDGDAWIVNAIVSTIALPFWAYLMGAVTFADHHDGNLAAILVIFFSIVSGLIAPRPRKRKLHEAEAAVQGAS